MSEQWRTVRVSITLAILERALGRDHPNTRLVEKNLDGLLSAMDARKPRR